MVCGTAPVWVERGGRLERTGVRFAHERDLRDAIERILAPLGPARRRGRAAVRRAAARRLARECRDPAAGARRPGADDPALSPARLHAPTSWSPTARCTRPLLDFLGARRARPREPAGLRRHRLRQDDDAERAVELHRRRRARGHDRGRRRAAAAPAARRPARGAAAEPRGPRRGDDPPARAQRAADAAGPDRRRRGARPGGARHADRAVHRSRRLAVHDPRRQRRPRRCGASRRSR